MAGLTGFVVLMASFSEYDPGNSSGAPPGYTNSPHDGMNCTHCMGGTATPVVGWITSDVPADGYKNDSIYHITVTATGAGNKGFEVSPQDATGALIGTLYSATGMKLVGSGVYITHSAAKSGNPSTWTFQWKAPSTGNNDITFYGSIAVTKLQTKTTTMVISKNTVGIGEPEALVTKLYPNPGNGNFTLDLQHQQAGIVQVEVTDMHGRVISHLMNEYRPAGSLHEQFNLSQMSGIYLVKVFADEKAGVGKLVIL